MRKGIAWLNERREANGRADRPFAIGANSEILYLGVRGSRSSPAPHRRPEPMVERLARYATIGVNQIQLRFRSRSAAELCDQIDPLRRRDRPPPERGLSARRERAPHRAVGRKGRHRLGHRARHGSGHRPRPGREGADIAMGARRDRGLIKVAGEVEALGRRAVWVQTDITIATSARPWPAGQG